VPVGRSEGSRGGWIVRHSERRYHRPPSTGCPSSSAPTDFDLRLDPGVHEPEVIRPLFRPYPMEALSMPPVSRFVNRPRNDGPECVAPLAGEAA